MSTVVYPGTFDPVTNGHIDLVRRASKLFPNVLVAIASSDSKNPMFTLQERISLTEEVLEVEGIHAKVTGFSGLLANLMREKEGGIILRGLRAISDFEYELQLANTNRALLPNTETLFMTPAVEYGYISSTMVREIARLDGDVSTLVHPCIAKAMQDKQASASSC